MDKEDTLLKRILAKIAERIKKSLPFVYEVIPETEIHGFSRLEETVVKMSQMGFKLRTLVSENQIQNVNAINTIR
mgnify:CR=1 FL=1